MKKYLLLSMCIIAFFCAKAQVPNDDCSTATDLGTLSFAWPGEVCSDGTNTGFSAVTYGNTFGATPSSPYYSMSDCYGYSNTTTTLANDIWFKFKNPANGVILRVPTSDTIHINLYHGANCANLQPSGCWTHDMTQSQQDFYTSNDTNIWNYIQISGITPNDSLYYGVCLQIWPQIISYFGVIHVNNNVNILDKNDVVVRFQLSPNPTNGDFELKGAFLNTTRMEIFDVTGRVVYSQELQPYSGTYTITLPEDVSGGVYNCVVISGAVKVSKKMVIMKQ